MLRKIRIGISVILFALITFYFLDFAGIAGNNDWLMKIQFIPALLSMSVGIFVVLIALTLLFGRIYCSTICPLGILQDIAARLSRSVGKNKKKKRYQYSPAKNILRWSIFAITLIATVTSFPFVLGLLDPYSAYGRIAVHVFKPVYMLGNNLLESVFSKFDNYTFYQVDASVLSVSSLVIALVTLVIVFFLAWKHGRTWCNVICPVGTFLGLLSRFSLFKVRIDMSKCNGCGVCATKCKAACIHSKEHSIDYSRCVDCYDCLEACKQKALVYTPAFKKNPKPLSPSQTPLSMSQEFVSSSQTPLSTPQEPLSSSQESLSSEMDDSKRRFLTTGIITAGAGMNLLAFAQKTFTVIGGKKEYKTKNPIIPPGAVSREHFNQHCTSCHLCVSKCPSHVLKPAFMDYGLEGIMQPTVNFEKGFCNFDCTVCGDVCPNGAIRPLTIEQKHLTQMGYVVFIKENCIVYTDGTNCGACSEHCPTQAIAMVPFKDGLTVPKVDTEICVGCGGCEYVCPARPFKAAHIEGNPIQREAKPFKETEQHNVEVDDFGF